MDRLRILTLNIWNRQGPWEQRVAVIRRGLQELAPDIVGLQEVLRHDGSGEDQATEIARGLGYHVVYAPAVNVGGGLHLGNAVLSRHPIVEKREWQLPIELGEETRCLVHALVDTPCGQVPFFNTHLSWKLHQGALRQSQVQFIAERVQELAPIARDRFPPVLVGDFNAEPESDEIRFLRGWHALGGRTVYLADCFAIVGEGHGHTFSRRNHYAALVHEPNRRLDYVFVRGPDRQYRGEPIFCQVVFDKPDSDDTFASDHFGVYAELSTGSA
jgi:endonuclease/exonuclease/phosphatase family metal-dependent hydrolase